MLILFKLKKNKGKGGGQVRIFSDSKSVIDSINIFKIIAMENLCFRAK